MKSKQARDAIVSVIDDQLNRGLTKPVQVFKYNSANKSIFETLSGMLERPLTLYHQLYLNERKIKSLEV
jgi:hypothetical protein